MVSIIDGWFLSILPTLPSFAPVLLIHFFPIIVYVAPPSPKGTPPTFILLVMAYCTNSYYGQPVIRGFASLSITYPRGYPVSESIGSIAFLNRIR